MEFKTSDELREFILNRQEFDEEPQGQNGPVWQLSWKKDSWIIKRDNKKVAELTTEQLPPTINIKSPDFVMQILPALRMGGLDALFNLIKGLK